MSVDSQVLLEQLLNGQHLSEEQAGELMQLLAEGSLEPARAGALLVALRANGENADEIRGFANAMRNLAQPFSRDPNLPAADSVGTGGDGSGSLNLSTGAALLAAACGVPMVKHGNRSVSSKSGSADVLEALGVKLPGDPKIASDYLAHTNFTFLFAQVFHPAMKNIAPIRAALGVRTVFNILGPLTNPAAPPFSLIGAFSSAIAKLMAESLAGMPHVQRAFVVHGEPGWDEPTPAGRFELFAVTPGQVHREQRDPRDYGIARCQPEDLAGGDAEYNARALEAVLLGRDPGPHQDALMLGAGLILEVTGRVSGLHEGISVAEKAIRSGEARKFLRQLRAFSEALK
ncbi:MAG: anthranilate phosphoribosyltransferase [Gammaproteobacteria bacterium]|nr:anthranilate phosphoribosyltransferase [Gammaproteobacteria bacterium]MCP4089963.1 anthranilate phosphoribosyltransferase [Gammaproteobacteria bacterium]MCP4276294.1 anthranilate phosphoribosyltransferase [Gammaproteobacteria bacterium]MCP4831289.1 anthranilate phosphoribosyltransferase [Gammaproteobacteria bacterium]MCP4928772.1 anthranilate phosphoribosyltransferase [Gammaproteobacteria bacterium]